MALHSVAALSDDLEEAGPTEHVVQARVILRRRCRSRSSNVSHRPPIPTALAWIVTSSAPEGMIRELTSALSLGVS